MSLELLIKKIGNFQELKKNNEIKEDTVNGVYFWIENIGGKNFINYIGETTKKSIYERQLEHIHNQLSGLYRLADFKYDGNPSYIPRKFKEIDIFFDQKKFINLVNRSYSFLNRITFFYAHHENTKEIKQIENFLIQKYFPLDNTIGTAGTGSKYLEVTFNKDGDLRDCDFCEMRERNIILLRNSHSAYRPNRLCGYPKRIDILIKKIK